MNLCVLELAFAACDWTSDADKLMDDIEDARGMGEIFAMVPGACCLELPVGVDVLTLFLGGNGGGEPLGDRPRPVVLKAPPVPVPDIGRNTDPRSIGLLFGSISARGVLTGVGRIGNSSNAFGSRWRLVDDLVESR